MEEDFDPVFQVYSSAVMGDDKTNRSPVHKLVSAPNEKTGLGEISTNIVSVASQPARVRISSQYLPDPETFMNSAVEPVDHWYCCPLVSVGRSVKLVCEHILVSAGRMDAGGPTTVIVLQKAVWVGRPSSTNKLTV